MISNPRTREDPELRRTEILNQAIGLIGELGYYGFTIQELGRRCGLSKPGLLHYFPSKHEVLLAVLRELEARETDVMSPLVQSAEHEFRGAEGKAAVLHIVTTIVARAMAQPDICRLLAELQSEALHPAHPAHEWWLKREAAVLGLFTGLLAPYLDEPDCVARQLLAMMDGLGLQWLRAEQSFDVVAVWERALRRLLPELHR